MKYDKLIRDKIPEILKNKNLIPVTHIADNDEYYKKLKAKLKEEVNEFLEEDNEEELADILEVMEAIYKFKNINKDKLELIRKEKLDKRGGFEKRIILDKIEDNN